MEPDNVDIFKKIIFRIPSTRKIATTIVGLGIIYALIMAESLRLFTEIGVSWITVPILALFVFIGPALVSGELLHRILPDYPRSWGYFLAASNQLILFIFSVIISGADNLSSAWSIVWLGLITVYLSNFLVLALTISTDHIKRIGLLSFVQPITVLAAFHLFLGRFMLIPITTYVLNLGLLVVAGALLLLMIYTVEYLIGSNVSNISAFQLTSGLLQKKQAALDLGYPADIDVQTLKIENESGSMSFGIPWVHPGPLGGFGGGSLSTKIIETLNTADSGFFLHVPSTHRSDPANPEDNNKIIDALGSPELGTKASKLISEKHSHGTFYGRKFGDKNIVFIDIPDYDDFEISIFRDLLDTDRTILIDLHQEDMNGTHKTMYYNTSIAETIRDDLLTFIEQLEEQETHDYKAGYHVKNDGKPFMALIEEVADQKTVLIGVEGNGLSENIRNAEKELEKRFDKVVALSTDTHTSIHDLATDEHLEFAEITHIVDEAEKNISAASIGATKNVAEKIKLLKDDYNGLIFSINILIRLIPILLILLYLVLIVWLL